jgi:uncharacterized membrane protein YqjE
MADDSAATASPLRALGRTALEAVHTRAELLSVELAQEQVRVAQLALYAALATLATGLGLQLAAVLAVASFWDTPYRGAAVIGAAALFIAAGAVCAGVFIRKWRAKPAPFGTSLRALKDDLDALRRTS